MRVFAITDRAYSWTLFTFTFGLVPLAMNIVGLPYFLKANKAPALTFDLRITAVCRVNLDIHMDYLSIQSLPHRHPDLRSPKCYVRTYPFTSPSTHVDNINN